MTVAVTSAVVGVFTVTRGQSFAGHSLADIPTTGGSGAFLLGLNQFWGYLAFGAGAAAFMEMIGIQRARPDRIRPARAGHRGGAGPGATAELAEPGPRRSPRRAGARRRRGLPDGATLVVGGYLVTYLHPRWRRPERQQDPDPEHACSPA